MASGKRASMREGPLAALFRKTEEDGAPDRRRRPRASRSSASPSRPRPSASAAPEPTPASEPSSPAGRDPPERRRRVARERPVALRGRAHARGAPAHASSRADIPENIMEREPGPPRPEPRYANEREPIHQPASPLHA